MRVPLAVGGIRRYMFASYQEMSFSVNRMVRGQLAKAMEPKDLGGLVNATDRYFFTAPKESSDLVPLCQRLRAPSWAKGSVIAASW
jgi:hypothetical protein